MFKPFFPNIGHEPPGQVESIGGYMGQAYLFDTVTHLSTFH